MDILTAIQQDFIRHLSSTALAKTFFLTGGTALSAFYMRHRLSDDLDFFTEEDGQVVRALPIIQNIAAGLGGTLEVSRNFRTFLEFSVECKGQLLRCDFAMDSPYRLHDRIHNEDYGIDVDNVLDISCNKLSALYDRTDLKDFVDIYFINREIIPFEELVVETKKKHIGLDNYWLAVSLAKIEDMTVLPRMLKPVTMDELRAFFRQKAEWLMKDH
jgi:predicted nucleotidyltransferase component of viral defense system